MESETGTGGESEQEDDSGDLGNVLAGLGNVLGSDRAASGRGRALAPRSEERIADHIEAVLAAMGTGGADSVKGSKKGGSMEGLMDRMPFRSYRSMSRIVLLNRTLLELCDSVKTDDDLDVVRAALIQ